MTAHLTILASGSSGNAALLHDGSSGVLIDCGLGPRLLGYRLAAVGLKWSNVTAAVLTHTHGDHWNRLTVQQLVRLRIPFYAHQRHHADLTEISPEHQSVREHGLLRSFEAGVPFEPAGGITARPVPVPHDSDPTFAFRFDGSGWAVGFASDLGSGTPELVRAFAGVDVMALEFNHDEEIERTSGRPPHLIARVLGRNGHLSNRQAAELSRDIISRGRSRLRSLVQLHLSRHCNRHDLARAVGAQTLAAVAPTARLWTASQDIPCGPIPVQRMRGPDAPVTPVEPKSPVVSYQPSLPGLG
jgi:phosphoribosyl 1,2-cyclic phosphodiesterase